MPHMLDIWACQKPFLDQVHSPVERIQSWRIQKKSWRLQFQTAWTAGPISPCYRNQHSTTSCPLLEWHLWTCHWQLFPFPGLYRVLWPMGCQHMFWEATDNNYYQEAFWNSWKLTQCTCRLCRSNWLHSYRPEMEERLCWCTLCCGWLSWFRSFFCCQCLQS